MKIAFADHYIGRRGSAVALYDLAHYNETILGNKSIILNPKHPDNCPLAIQKFKDRFEYFEHDLAPQGHGQWNLPYGDVDQADAIIKEQGVDALFLMRGCYIPFTSKIVPNLVQMLFINEPGQYFGDRFAFISDWLSDLCKQRYKLDKPSVPWMINIEDTDKNLREELGIPADAMVLGYHGGADCFGIPWVGEPIRQALEKRSNLYIVLVNVDQAMTSLNFSHPRLIFLPGFSDMKRKAEFIKTCDAMLHARHHGETFGLSCGEFSILNRPVIAATTVEDRCHIDLLGDSLLGYRNPQELFNILMSITHEFIASRDWDKYSQKFSPEATMKKFKEIYLDNL